jgi:hypothetical protein
MPGHCLGFAQAGKPASTFPGHAVKAPRTKESV